MTFLIVFLTAFALTLGLTPLFARLAPRAGFVDVPTPGKPKHIHRRPIPRLGVSLYIAFAVTLAITAPVPRSDPHEWLRLGGMLAALTLVEIMGLIDDRYELGPVAQFGALLIAAVIVITTSIRIDQITNPLGTPIDFPRWFAVLPRASRPGPAGPAWPASVPGTCRSGLAAVCSAWRSSRLRRS